MVKGEVQSPLERGVLSPFHRKEIEDKDEDSLQTTLSSILICFWKSGN